jgi:hypothetical protein
MYKRLYKVECLQYINGTLDCDIIPTTTGLFSVTTNLKKATEIYDSIKFEDFDRWEVVRHALRGRGTTFNKMIKCFDIPIKLYNKLNRTKESRKYLDESCLWDESIELDNVKDELFEVSLYEIKDLRPYVEQAA